MVARPSCSRSRPARRAAQLLVMAPACAAAAARAGLAKRRHVPCVAVDDAALIEAPEAQDLVAVLDALVSPQHCLSLARAAQPAGSTRPTPICSFLSRAGAAGDWWAPDELAVRRWRCARWLLAAWPGGRAPPAAARSARPHRRRGANCASASPRVCPPRSGGAGRRGCSAGPVAGARRRALCHRLCLRARAAPAHDRVPAPDLGGAIACSPCTILPRAWRPTSCS